VKTSIASPPQRSIQQIGQSYAQPPSVSTRRRDSLHPATGSRSRRTIVTADQLVLFSTETGDAWLLDPSDHVAARLARDGDPESIAFEETDTSFQIAWPGNYRLDGPAFVYTDRQSRRVSTIIGHPTQLLAAAERR